MANKYEILLNAVLNEKDIKKQLKIIEKEFNSTLGKGSKNASTESKKFEDSLKISAEQLKKMKISSQDVFKEFNKGGETAKEQTKALNKEMDDLTREIQKQISLQGELDSATVKGFNNKKKLISAEIQTMKAQNIDASKQPLTQLGDTFKKVAGFGAVTAIITATTMAFSKMVESVFELDNAMTEVNKVMNLTSDEMTNLKDHAFELGSEIGRTGTEVVNAVAEFGRAGYDMKDSLDLAETALVMTNVADGITDVGDASQSIIGIIKGFGLATTDANKILDLINYTSNNSATSFEGLTDVLTRSSATMKQMGNTMNETVGLATAALEILGTDQSERIGRGLNSLSLRISGISDVEGESAVATSKLNDELERLTGVTVFGANGQLKSTFDILSELSPKWGDLSKNTQVYLGELLAGKTQISTFNAIMQNFDTALANSDTALQATGSAMKENEAFMSSLEGKTNKLISEFEKFSNSVLNSGLIGGILDLGTGLLQMENATGLLIPGLSLLAMSTIPALETALTGLGVALGIGTGGLTWIITGIIALITAVPKLVDAVTTSVSEQKDKVDELSSSLGNLNTEYKKLSEKENRTEYENQKLAILSQQIKIREREIELNKTLLAQKEILGKGEFGGGLSEQSLYDARELQYYVTSYKELTAAMEEYSDKTSKSYDIMAEKLKTHEASIVSLSGKLVDENAKMAESLQYLSGEEAKQVQARIDANNELINSSSIIQDIIGYQTGLGESTDDTSVSMDEQSNSVGNLEKTLATLSDTVKDTIDKNDVLYDSLIKLKSGQELTRAEIDNLIETYPQLLNELVRTNDGYTLNIESLEALKNANIDTAREAINAEIRKTEQTIASVRNRIMAHQQEIDSIQGLAKAYSLLAQSAISTRATIISDPFLGRKSKIGGDNIPPYMKKPAASAEDNKALEESYRKLNELKKQSLRLNVSVANAERDTSRAVAKNLEKSNAKADAARRKANAAAEKARREQEKIRKELEKALERYGQIKDKISEIGKELRGVKDSSAELTSNLKQLKAKDFSAFQMDRIYSLKELEPLLAKQKAKIKKLNDDLYTLSTKNNKKITEKRKKELDKQLEQVKARIKTEEDIQKKYASNLEKIRADMEKDYEKRVDKEVENRIESLKKANEEEIKLNKKKEETIKSQQEALKELHDLTMDMIKEEKNEEIDGIQSQIDAIDKLAEARKKALKEEQDARNYEKALKKKEKEIGTIEKRIAELQFDTSSKGIKERLELESELATQKEELEDTQYDKSIEKQEKAIDEQTQREKNKLEGQINQLKAYLSQEGQIRADANKLIESHSKELYNKLIAYNRDYVGMSGKELEKLYSTAISGLEEWGGSIGTVTTAFDNMSSAVDNLAQKLEKLQDFEISDEMEETFKEEAESNQLPASMKDAQGERKPKLSESDAKANMQRNQQQYLHNLAQEAKRTNNKAQISWVESERSRWGLDKKSGAVVQEGKVPENYYQSNKGKYGIYHNGGFVGGIKSNETFAKLLDGEFVSNKAQMNNLIDKTIPKITQETVERFSTNNSIENFMNITVNGDLTKESIPELERLQNVGIKQLTQGMKNRGLRVNARNYGI